MADRDGAPEMRLLDALHRLNKSVLAEARTHVASVADLDLADFLVLRTVKLGVDSPGEIVQDLGLHPSVVSRTLTKLAKAALVLRTVDSADSRRSRLSLTAAGEAASADVEARIRPLLRERLGRLSESQAVTLLRYFDILNGES